MSKAQKLRNAISNLVVELCDYPVKDMGFRDVFEHMQFIEKLTAISKITKSEIKPGDLVDAPNHAPDRCLLIGIWEDKAWLMYPEGGTTVAPIDSIVLHCDKGFTKTRFTSLRIEPCSEEMREHLKGHHGNEFKETP